MTSPSQDGARSTLELADSGYEGVLDTLTGETRAARSTRTVLDEPLAELEGGVDLDSPPERDSDGLGPPGFDEGCESELRSLGLIPSPPHLLPPSPPSLPASVHVVP